MRLFQHREIYYIEINGQRRSLKTRDKTEAKRLFNQVKKEWLAGKLAHLTGECRMTLKEFRDEYVEWAEKVKPHSTFRADRLAIDKLIQYAGEKTKLNCITTKHVDVMKAHLAELSPASVNNYIRHMRVVLNKAVEWKYILSNPLSTAKEIKLRKIKPAFLDGKQAAHFIASIKDVDLRLQVVAYLTTGRRRSELVGLKWEDVDLQNGTYKVTAKGGDDQLYYIRGTFGAVLRSLNSKRKSDQVYVFNRWRHPDTISHEIKKALKTAGFGHLHLHHLRHTFASWKAMEGKSLIELQGLLGHKHINATTIYSHLTDDHLSEISGVNLGPIDLGD
jgi:integrase